MFLKLIIFSVFKKVERCSIQCVLKDVRTFENIKNVFIIVSVYYKIIYICSCDQIMYYLYFKRKKFQVFFICL